MEAIMERGDFTGLSAAASGAVIDRMLNEGAGQQG
jgi:hypothetical protein